MEIRSLELKNYRNYNSQQVFFDKGVNVLVGKNAQGKTNMLESIFLCAIGKSPRTNKEKELIRWESTFAKTTLELSSIKGDKKIEFFIFENQSKAIKVNGFALKKIGELMGEFKAVYFSPDELKLVKESPSERRKFMDISLSQFDKNYFYNISKYSKIMAQRNKLLKSTKDINVLLDTLPIWNEQLALYGAKIIFERMKFIKEINKIAFSIHKELTGGKEELYLSYLGLTAPTEFEIKEKLLDELNACAEKDAVLGFTSVGPHRDDIRIMVNNIDARTFGSQGQQRTVALSLKLAELEFFYNNFGEYPVLLLDDVLSELDDNRQQKLLEYVSKIQTIITCTSFPFDIKAKIFRIENGYVVENN